MKKLTLGGRLGLSFGALILLMALLGGLAVWRINIAVRNAASVATIHTPEVRAAHNAHVAAWKTLHHIPSYALTGEAEYLRKGRQALVLLKADLTTAEELAARFPELVDLRIGEIAARTKVADFESLLEQIEDEYKSLAVQGAALDAEAKSFMQHCQALRVSQLAMMSAELDGKVDAAKVKEQLAKMALVEDAIDHANDIRVANFKARSIGDMDAMRNALRAFIPLDNTLARLSPSLREQADIDQLAKAREASEGYKTAMEKVIKSQLAIREHAKSLVAAGEVVTAKVAEVAGGGLQSIEQAANEVVSGLSVTGVVLLVGLAIALIAGVLVAWLSTSAITGPIREGVNALASTASQISATISQLASNASETAAAVSETTTTVEEVRQIAQVAAEKAKTVADSAQGATRAAEAGRQATEQATQGLRHIRDQMTSIGETITRLNEQSQSVGDIVATVTDLADQSNILAVNASIEAAKAGEQGRGFSVVAQEIRNLAEQSRESTKQVRTILTEVQKATGKAVQASVLGGHSVVEGGRQAEEAGLAIGTLTATVQEANRAAVQIAASSQQQLVGMEQVGRAMENIRQATTQNAEGARQLATAAHNLQGIGTRLKALVDAGGASSPKPGH
jgi:hypothetical protein